MPLSRPELTLGADPRAAAEARRWVTSACEDLGRADLVECAELGVSELVTNALLHAGAPIQVRVRGTREHPRIEVADGSHEPPVLTADADDEDELMFTFGRGLQIVARCSESWGAAIEPDGKVVWFEPTTSPHQESGPEGSVFDLSDLLVGSDTESDHVAGVSLHSVPIAPLLLLRQHYQELRREVRLLSLAHEDEYPLAKTLTDVFSAFDRAYPPAVTHQVATAVAEERTTVDLEIALDPTRVATFEQMITLLDLADEFCHGERLLALARTPDQAEFQRWFLGEFVRQARGEDAQPWMGPSMIPTPAADDHQRSAKIVS
ncbi:ATP-binding protein [Nocardioides sp.]|uniref:ATP-binding protein n=1 Tax=Nocardioides sp. TaxID=35761 RepID=UPI003527ACDF